MSRGALMRRFERVIAAQEHLVRPSSPGLRRRDLVFSSGLLGLVPALAAQPRAVGTGKSRVAIVGGGIAGLMAALTLHEAGQDFELFEAASRFGGRMHSNKGFWAQGQTSEWCGESIDSTHRLMRGLARRFGLTLDDVNAAVPPRSVDTNFLLGTYYTDAELAADLQPVLPVLLAQRAAVGNRVRYDDHNEAAVLLDHMSCHEWIERFVHGGHDSRLGRYLDLALISEYGLDTPRLSSLNIVLPMKTDERFHVRGGNEQIPQAIVSVLPRRALRLGWRMTEIVADGYRNVALGFETPAGARWLEFDRVILCLPFSVLRGLTIDRAGFDARKLAMIRQLEYGTNSKLSLQFDRRYWNQRGAWPGISNGWTATDIGFQSTWDTSRAQRGAYGLLTNYTGGSVGAAFRPDAPYTDSQSSSTAAYATDFLAQLEQVWPGISPHYQGRATLSCPTTDPNLLGSYSGFGRGQFTSFCGYGGVPQGRIHFAGEHTSVRYLGFMEGGAETGLLAAREVLAS